MRIAIFYELEKGGARRAADELSAELKKTGHTVDLYVVNPNFNLDSEACYSAVRIYKFVPVAWQGGNWRARLYRDTVELFRLRQLHTRVARDIDIERYDLVLAHSSRFTQAPFILHFLRTYSAYYCQEQLRLVYDPLFAIPRHLSIGKKVYEQLSRLLRKWIDRRNILAADKILTNSRYTQKQIQLSYGLKSVVSHLGVRTVEFYPSSPKKYDLLFIGAKDGADGYRLLQEALNLMPKRPTVHYHIRGERWVSVAQLREIYAQAKIVVCLSEHEPFGLIALEAMACDSAVVALNDGGYTDSVKHGKTGVLVLRDPQQLANALGKLLSNTVLRKKIVLAAHKNIEEYWTWQKAAERLLAHLTSLQ